MFLFILNGLLWTVRAVVVEMFPLRKAVQEYSPASDVDTLVSVRILEMAPRFEMWSAGVGVTPGPSHWKTGVPVTPLGREMVQVRVTESPAMTAGEEGVREIVAGSVRDRSIRKCVNHVWQCSYL